LLVAFALVRDGRRRATAFVAKPSPGGGRGNHRMSYEEWRDKARRKDEAMTPSAAPGTLGFGDMNRDDYVALPTASNPRELVAALLGGIFAPIPVASL